MSELIAIKLAEAALEAQARQMVSKASFDEAWLLKEQAQQEVVKLKAKLQRVTTAGTVISNYLDDYAEAVGLDDKWEAVRETWLDAQ